MATKPGHIKILEDWLKSYKPEDLFDPAGKLIPELAELAPGGTKRMGANPHANGGLLLNDLEMPDFNKYAVDITQPGTVVAEATLIMGSFIRDTMKLNWNKRNFRIFGPDETASNRLTKIFNITGRVSTAEILPGDDHISPDGRVMEVLSEHLCQGWLEGYLITAAMVYFPVMKHSFIS